METFMRKIILLIFLNLIFSIFTFSQEIDCDLKINLEALTTSEAKDNLSDFVQQVKSYINDYRWTQGEFGDGKIKCVIDISFRGSEGTNHYIAQAFIGSQRHIFKTNRTTALLRIMDDKWEFDYVRNQSLNHMETRYDPLLSFIDFYVYLILGYDADTYQTNGGTPYFQKAFDIANVARGSGTDAKGWELSQQGLYSRAQLIEELLNPKFQDFRKAVHIYHYRGIDSLFTNSKRPLNRVYLALDKIAKLKEKINQTSLVIKTFFDTKYLEIAEVFLKSNDPMIYSRLSRIDPEHTKTYDEYAEKRKL